MLFNVRSLEERWGEVLLLLEKYNPDCIVLNEVGAIDQQLIGQIFVSYKWFYQKGENAWGGVLMIFKPSLPVSRVKCDIPNICVVDVKVEKNFRIMGMYAPKSKSWDWNVLSQFVTEECCIVGDFNVDILSTVDDASTKKLLTWSESLLLSPVLPGESTSRRSNRIIDYAFVKGVELSLQTGADNSTSDHRPVLGTVKRESRENILGSNTHWKVFNVFLSLTAEFWEKESQQAATEEYYSNFVTLLDLLKSRCTTHFELKNYRSAIPKELRMKLSYVRALSFRHKRTGDTALRMKIKEMRRANREELIELRTRKLECTLKERFSSSNAAKAFWSKTRKNFKRNCGLEAFLDTNNKVVRNKADMLDIAALHYGNLFAETEVYRPHPYVDSPEVHWDNYEEKIPPIKMPELLRVVAKVKKKLSSDAHGISTYMLKFLPPMYFVPLLKIFNESLTTGCGPSYWKKVKMKLLPKKDPICAVGDTRPISMLDIFLKILERLFLVRFQKVLTNRGLIHDSQSGFRPNFRLQSRVLALIDQVSSLMSTSTPVATVFVDFRQAFDQLWWEGCIGKLLRLGIPKAYVHWIEKWLRDRTGFIEMNDKRSKSFAISKGGPQGSCLTPAVFITYHSDMWSFIMNSIPNFFADDLACVVGGSIGVKYSLQCLDVERKLKQLFDHLEFYTVLSVQPINYQKTVWMWSARAVGNPKFEICMGENKIERVNEFRYLGYLFTSKLSWASMIKQHKYKVREKMRLVRVCKFAGTSSYNHKKVLFMTFVRPLFTWLCCLFPLLTECQQVDLSHFYCTCIKRIVGTFHWNDLCFSFFNNEETYENICNRYWNKYYRFLQKSEDGRILLEHASWNLFRKLWMDREYSIAWIYRSGRFIEFSSVIEKGLHWMEASDADSIPWIPLADLELLAMFPESFLE